MPANKAIIILGGGLVQDHGKWRTTGFTEGDQFGVLGDRLRVEAAYVLYAQDLNILLFVLGGVGQQKNVPDAPTAAGVIKKELIELGVPERSIITEEQSSNTWQQLQALKGMIKKENLTDLLVISNRYHLPRLSAMIEKAGEIKVNLAAAEDILIAHDPAKWQALVKKAYQTEAMKQRIKSEEKGVAAINSGTYKLE